ncbi:MAG: GNAT family N-acetyltransferase [Bacteroidota bacterium]
MAESGSFSLRKAVEADAAPIRRLIEAVGINPMGLDWKRFIVAVDAPGGLMGCGQLKPHGPDILELASIAVEAGRRREGIARAIIEELIEDAPRPLYLMCRDGLGPFYQKFGFQPLELEQMPRYFQRMKKLIRVYERLSNAEETVLVMKLQ